MNGFSENQIEAIQSSGCKAAVVLAGGGISAAYALLSHPGASRFVFEVQVPYSPEAMFDYLGEKIHRFCSGEAAGILAERAYERALAFSVSSGGGFPILGIACTAALQTNRQRKGKDRAFICIRSSHRERARSIELPAGSRGEQETAVSLALLNMIEEFVGEGME